MSMYSIERRRQAENQEKRLLVIRKLKGELAQSATLRIYEELNTNPDVIDFTTPILRPEPLALKILKYSPEQVARLVNIGRLVTLALNDTVEPPMLRIQLGEAISNPNIES